jgi:lipid-A-disaccharide synthase
MGRRLYIIAGEASGDLHGANLVKALRRIDPAVEVRAWGRRPHGLPAGAEVVKHIRELAFMGFAEVVMNLRTIARNLRFCKEDIRPVEARCGRADRLPGFNLRIAEYVHGLGIKVIYYISPQLWAWKAGPGREGEALRRPHALHPSVREGVVRAARCGGGLRRSPLAGCDRR